MARPSPQEAIGVLRHAFQGFDPYPYAPPEDEDYSPYGDPVGALHLNALREGRAGELADRLRREEAAALIPMEGYVQGEPGRRYRSVNPFVSARLTRGRLEDLGAEMAADPYTGQTERERVQKTQDVIDTALRAQRPEVADAEKL